MPARGPTAPEERHHDAHRALRHLVHALSESANAPVHSSGTPGEAVDPRRDPAHAEALAELVREGEGIPMEPVVVTWKPLSHQSAQDQ